MFKEWYQAHPFEKIDFSSPLFPPAKDRAYWERKTDRRLIVDAEQYLGFSWPAPLATDYIAFRTEGSRIKQETPHFDRRRALLTLFLGELAEYKGRFLPDLVNGLMAISEETFWGGSAHYKDKNEAYLLPDARHCYIDIFAAETASLFAVIYRMLYEELEGYCPEILSRMEYETERRIIEPYLSHNDFWWMGFSGRKPNNWNPWILSNLLTVFLMMERRRSVFLTALRKMFRELDNYYGPYPLDGGCDEGANYWSVAGATLFEFCEQLYTASAGAIDFFYEEKFRNTGRYIYRVYIGEGRFVNFADGTPGISPSLAGLLYLFGQRIGDPRLSAMAKVCPKVPKGERSSLTRDSKVKRALYELIYREEIEKLTAPLPEDGVLESIQNAFACRGAWYCAVKGGHNGESHNHNDVGSFMVYWNRQPILIDPGCGTYTAKTFSPNRYEIWTMQSSWHNLPEINHLPQMNGSAFSASEFYHKDGETTVSFGDAYPQKAGAEQVKRRVGISEKGITVEDTFAFREDENQVDEHFMTLLPVAVKEGAVQLGDRFLLRSLCPAEILLEKKSFEGDEKLQKSWETEGMTRISFRFRAGKREKITFILEELK